MKSYLLLLAFLCFGWISAQDTSLFFKKANVVFSTYVTNGRVDYEAINKNPELLNEALNEVKKITVASSNKAIYQAFWINTYNLLTIKGIVNNYPINSPLDIDGFFDKTTYTVAGLNVTLNTIENKLLREKFPDEPRFHFVLVCGAISCPPIINKAYLPNYLEKQLEQQTTLALNNSEFIRVDSTTVQFSKIMDWYNEDFTKQDQSLIEYVNTYRKTPIPNTHKTGFYNYNWSLNDSKH